MTAFEPPPTPPLPPDPAAGAACPRCGAPLRPDQDWCLNCGAAVTTEVAGARGWQTPIAIVAVVLAVAAGALIVAFLEITDDADRLAATPVTTPTPAVTPPAVVTPTPSPTPSPSPSPVGSPSPAPPAAIPGTTPGATPGAVTPPGASPTPGTGTGTSTRPTTTPTPFPTGGTTPGAGSGTIASWPAGREAWTVILLSARTRADAEKKAREYQAQGKSVGVLNSSDYSSLRPGYWVVFSGQYDDRKQAQAAADGLKSTAPQAYARFVKPK